MNLSDFDDLLTFPLARPWGHCPRCWVKCLYNWGMDCYVTHVAHSINCNNCDDHYWAKLMMLPSAFVLYCGFELISMLTQLTLCWTWKTLYQLKTWLVLAFIAFRETLVHLHGCRRSSLFLHSPGILCFDLMLPSHFRLALNNRPICSSFVSTSSAYTYRNRKRQGWGVREILRCNSFWINQKSTDDDG